mgnify:FL=1|tara:strand:- start:5563 stop:5886 length:324 start_codon:yes stop_codon:yes gene_type:complete
MLGKVRTVLGFINTVINIVQLGIMGKKALETDTGKKVVKKTGDVAKDVACAGAEAGTTAYRHVSKTAGTVVDEVGNRLKRKPKKKDSEQSPGESVCGCPEDCNEEGR